MKRLYEAPEFRVITVHLNNVMCLSGLRTLDGEEW